MRKLWWRCTLFPGEAHPFLEFVLYSGFDCWFFFFFLGYAIEIGQSLRLNVPRSKSVINPKKHPTISNDLLTTQHKQVRLSASLFIKGWSVDTCFGGYWEILSLGKFSIRVGVDRNIRESVKLKFTTVGIYLDQWSNEWPFDNLNFLVLEKKTVDWSIVKSCSELTFEQVIELDGVLSVNLLQNARPIANSSPFTSLPLFV